MLADIRVKTFQMPAKIRSFVKEDPDGSFDIIVNEYLSEERRRKVLAHEIDHINHQDLDCEDPADEIEARRHERREKHGTF